MPTAYTSLLGLALPVTGELQGTWGQTVNDAITSLLDTAVAGTTTLSTDADVTLTTTTGASNQARQAIILWTANGTTTRNITAPAQSKAYVVINASAGTQSIVIRGVGPTTGVTVAKGEKVLVAWNGSDFVRVAAYGGTGEFTTVDTTNLEVTNVKAKDGTSAATIADSTGVVTFTANPILNGGTANGVLYLNGSKVATSGSALTFDGTNAATTGTMSATKFIPTGGTATGNGLYLPAANTLAFSTNGTEQMRIDSSGNFGLGVTPSAWSGVSGIPVFQTQTASISSCPSGGSNTTAYATNAYYNGTSWLYRVTASASYYDQFGSLHRWFIAPSGTAGTAISFTQAMTLDNSGNLGIGTTSPAVRFHASSASSEVGRFESSSQPYISLYEGATRQVYLWSQTSLVELNVEVNKPLRFMTNGAERMRITAAGLVGIGNNSPTTALQVNGTGFFGPTSVAGVAYNVGSSNHSATQAANTGAGIGLYPPYTGYPSGLTGALLFAANEAASGFATYFAITTLNPGGGLSERMRITSNGNVGIGTSTVAAANALEIARGSTDAALISTRANGNSAATEFAIGQGSDGTTAFIYNRANGIMAFATNNTERMRLDASGNLGLGVTPSAWGSGWTALQVGSRTVVHSGPDGRASFGGNYYVDGTNARYIASAAATQLMQASGEFRFYTAASGTAGNTIPFTQVMTLDNSGNLGIGTTTPSQILDVSAANAAPRVTSSTGTNQVSLGFNNTGGNFFVGRDSSTGGWFGSGTGYTSVLWSQGAYPMALATNNTERMRISSTGNVGIGTSNPTSRLYVSGGVTTSNYGSNTLYSSVGSEFQAPGANGIYLDTDGWANATVISSKTGTVAATRSTYGLILTSTYGSLSYASAAVNINCTTGNGAISFYTGTGSAAPTEQFKVHDNGNALVLGVGGLGYGTGSGGAVTQATSRTTGVTLDKTNGAITLVSAAGTTTWQSFTVTNNKVVATDTVIVNQKSGTDLYEIHVTAVAAGSFRISFKTTGGTTTEQPVFNFAVIKAVTA